MAIKLIRRLKSIFERKLGLTFQNKETVLELNGCTRGGCTPQDVFRLSVLVLGIEKYSTMTNTLLV
jgi:hypothetical protein